MMGVNTERRKFIGYMGAAVAAGLIPGGVSRAFAAERSTGLPRGEKKPFSFEGVIGWAREQAKKPYQPPVISDALKNVLSRIDYDAYQKIRFDTDKALWLHQEGVPPIAPFHQNRGTQEKVRLYTVENGQAQEVEYDPSAFTYKGDIQAGDMPGDAGWGGFRALYEKDHSRDWLAFMGASYFRCAGPQDQYGLSARAVAVNIVLHDQPEEFPRFTEFWLEPAQDGGLHIYALLDSPSLTGAMKIACQKPNDTDIVMDVTVRFFTRQAIRRLGIAPLTSMFWFSETNRDEAVDWRPEIHDNDGLALWTGTGERLWRPLDNPKHTRTSSFVDQSPKGFGLMQRDRSFANYQDDGVFYDRRPSLWIEPKGDWNKGMVQLLEIPTDDEIHDNIGAYWTTDEEIPAGEERAWQYRMHWMKADMFGAANVGHTIATRTGRAGVPGQKRPDTGLKYAIDFAGGDLASYKTEDKKITADVSASNAAIQNAYCLRVVGQDYWRLVFDVFPDGNGPVNLRASLKDGDRQLTESWVFEHREHHF
ncbi:glucan biosynthesis protein [Thalassospira profundimaris]|nr:glucan biosynthesis protein [Thalassospira profundimaris]